MTTGYMSKAKQHGWTVGSHRALVNASQLIADEQDDEWFRGRLFRSPEIRQQVLR